MRVVETPKSSNIKMFEYDGKDLFVTFKNETKYQYESVPVQIFETIEKASDQSAGKWFFTNVRGKYKYQRLK